MAGGCLGKSICMLAGALEGLNFLLVPAQLWGGVGRVKCGLKDVGS